MFAIYPLALAMFKETNLPKKTHPWCIGLGAFSFTAVALPGSPQLQNILPIKYLGTTPMAAPTIGIICGIFIFSLGSYYMMSRAKAAIKAGEQFIAGAGDTRWFGREWR